VGFVANRDSPIAIDPTIRTSHFMITLTRLQIRRLRDVFRRAILGINNRGAVPPIVFRAREGRLRVQHRYRDLAVEHVEAGDDQAGTTVAIPLDAMGDFEGRDESPVVLEPIAADCTLVRWEDRGFPQSREYDVSTAIGQSDAMPDPPMKWTSNPRELLSALAEATDTCSPDALRYALDCVELQGGRGAVVATDGRQLLVRSGFNFGWEGNVLIRGSPIFGCRVLQRDQPIEIGKTDTQIVLRAGDWTIWLEIQEDARFPDTHRAIPSATEVVTWLKLDAHDTKFLDSALGRLPGRNDDHSPITVDLNGQVSIRAVAADQRQQATEVVLNRSSCIGPPLSISFDRNLLDQALRFGFTEIGFCGVERPLVCRNDRTIFVAQPLTGGSPLEPGVTPTRIESNSAGSGRKPTRSRTETPRTTMSARPPRTNGKPACSVATNDPTDSADGIVAKRDIGPENVLANTGQARGENVRANLPELIKEAEALHTALAEARSRTARLITGLRRYRKQSRLVSDTLKSLRDLKLQDVVA
jgi:hypothetical protein